MSACELFKSVQDLNKKAATCSNSGALSYRLPVGETSLEAVYSIHKIDVRTKLRN